MARPIAEVATDLGFAPEHLYCFGDEIAKVRLDALETPPRSRDARLILVSAITPTPAGEGKTTTSIGLAQGFARLGKSVCVALREPSLGPCFGIKGGATGGGASTLHPADQIDLHFTGDFHAITAANNLLAALLDNQLYFDNPLGIDPRRVLWRRVLDMNDRSLRNTVVGLGGATQGVPRETGFDITAASEVMAMLCLATGAEDLRERIERTLVAFTHAGEPVTAAQLGAAGAMVRLLRDALCPNLVQTVEGVPALVHGGPFANIAHGCSSVLATRMALHQADWAITEAGFGFDLGAEKFFDIKCQGAGLDPACVVLVATVRALKMHGGVKLRELDATDAAAVERGLPNLAKHIDSARQFQRSVVVVLNRFDADAEEEIEVVRRFCATEGVAFAVGDHFARGGEGTVELAEQVIACAERERAPFQSLYQWEQPVEQKIEAVARSMYGARGVTYTKEARRALKEIDRLGYQGLPICIAKTPKSLSDDPKLRGRPTGFDLTVRDLQINAGAGFLVVLTGEILRMPGLPRRPNALEMDG